MLGITLKASYRCNYCFASLETFRPAQWTPELLSTTNYSFRHLLGFQPRGHWLSLLTRALFRMMLTSIWKTTSAPFPRPCIASCTVPRSGRAMALEQSELTPEPRLPSFTFLKSQQDQYTNKPERAFTTRSRTTTPALLLRPSEDNKLTSSEV